VVEVITISKKINFLNEKYLLKKIKKDTKPIKKLLITKCILEK
jgi:hypothetical protein